MTDAAWAALDAAFDRALDLDDENRAAYLAALDAPTRSAVTALLRDALCDDPVLDGRAPVQAVLAEAATPAPDLFAGTQLGPYRLEALVGEGGMGRVYRAHRADGAFEQTVAVKVVRQSLALAGTDVAARLRRERAFLATLDHPSIARLLDGGETPDGVPYLVTEFVDGAPITDWAEARTLGVAERVGLLIEVAQAVEHAHRRSVVHRDLKPGNVLVAERDGAPRPVVLDFGIAKLVNGVEGPGAAALTQAGPRLLTPAYAAPELFEPGADVTTAADVYGLGALLYELLSGHRSHDDVRDRALPPPRPSRRLSSGAKTPERARRARAVRGDLDVICLKALHPDPSQRYPSAGALATDLERHLDGRPVEARPASVVYTLGRLARRHRIATAAVVVAVAALLGALTVSLVALGSEREARVQAEAAAERADEAARLLAGFFQAADPSDGDGEVVTVRQALDAGRARVATVESDTLRGYLDGVLGRSYIFLGEVTTADSLLASALATARRTRTLTRDELARVRLDYASTRDALDDHASALELCQTVLRTHRDAPSSPLALAALRGQARALLALERYDEAAASAGRAVGTAREQGDARELARALTQQGSVLTTSGRPSDALGPLREALALGSRFEGRDRKYASHALDALGVALSALGRHREAEAAFRESETYLVRVFGERTLGVAYMKAAAGESLLRRGYALRAAGALDSALVIARPHLPGDHRDLQTWASLRAECDTPRPASTSRAVVVRQPS